MITDEELCKLRTLVTNGHFIRAIGQIEKLARKIEELKKIDKNYSDDYMTNLLNECLLLSAENGDRAMCKMLFKKGADGKMVDSYDRNILHLACINGDVSTIKFLVDMKMDINAVTYAGITALTLSVDSSNIDAVKFLIKAGADLFYNDYMAQIKFMLKKQKLYSDKKRAVLNYVYQQQKRRVDLVEHVKETFYYLHDQKYDNQIADNCFISLLPGEIINMVFDYIQPNDIKPPNKIIKIPEKKNQPTEVESHRRFNNFYLFSLFRKIRSGSIDNQVDIQPENKIGEKLCNG